MALEELREFFAQLFQFEHKLQNWLMAENKNCEGNTYSEAMQQ
jgi:hypothetical protein